MGTAAWGIWSLTLVRVLAPVGRQTRPRAVSWDFFAASSGKTATVRAAAVTARILERNRVVFAIPLWGIPVMTSHDHVNVCAICDE